MKSNLAAAVTNPALLRQSKRNKLAMPVSRLSVYGDDEWKYISEIPQKNLSPSLKIIKWSFLLNTGEYFTGLSHTKLLESAKDFLLSLELDPPEGRRPLRKKTLVRKYYNVKPLIVYMVDKGFKQFAELDQFAINNYIAQLKQKNITIDSLADYLDILVCLFLQRNKLKDAIQFEPLDDENANAFVGGTRAYTETRKYPYIPEDISRDLISKALIYIEERADGLLHERDLIKRINSLKNANQKRLHWFQKNNLMRSLDLKYRGRKLVGELANLRTACFIIIAFFSGMRLSEILHIQKGSIKKVKSGSGDADLLWLHSITFKTSQTPEKAKWLVPPVVERAVTVAERLSEPLRKKSGMKEIFLVENGSDNNINLMTDYTANRNLKSFVRKTSVTLYKGKPWNLHAHQFRHSFAYYMAKENLCHILDLQLHFKHISLDMTAWYGGVSDSELKASVAAMTKEVNYHVLRKVLDSSHLAGQKGEHIDNYRSKYFKGATFKEIDSFLREYAENAYIRGTHIGYCFWSQNHAACMAGFECRCNPSKCDNAVVTEEHIPRWLAILERNENLLSSANLNQYQRDYIQNEIDSVILPVLKKLGYKV